MNKHFKRNKNSWLRLSSLHNFCSINWALPLFSNAYQLNRDKLSNKLLSINKGVISIKSIKRDIMSEMKQPWKKDTNDRYLDMVKSVVNLSTASLLLPVFLARNFIDIHKDTPLVSVFGCSIYTAWLLLVLSIISGLVYQYLSAKWLRIAWGEKAGILWSKDTSESTVENCMEWNLWMCVAFFIFGVAFTLYFFTTFEGVRF